MRKIIGSNIAGDTRLIWEKLRDVEAWIKLPSKHIMKAHYYQKGSIISVCKTIRMVDHSYRIQNIMQITKADVTRWNNRCKTCIQRLASYNEHVANGVQIERIYTGSLPKKLINPKPTVMESKLATIVWIAAKCSYDGCEESGAFPTTTPDAPKTKHYCINHNPLIIKN